MGTKPFLAPEMFLDGSYTSAVGRVCTGVGHCSAFDGPAIHEKTYRMKDEAGAKH